MKDTANNAGKYMKRKILSVLSLLLLTTLISCATPYKSSGLGGGYSDLQLDKDTFRVSFRGNGYTSFETVGDYLLYRSAELTLSHGYDYFLLVDNYTDVKSNIVTAPGTFNSNTTAYYGYYSTFGTYHPGQRIDIQKYKKTAIIKMIKGRKPAELANVYNAREIIHYMAASIRK